MSETKVVGIDLGTTYSLAAYVENGMPVVVRDASGAALVPSCVSFHDDGTVLVGTPAKERALADPTHTIFSVKRLMGRTLADLAGQLKHIPQQIVEREVEGGRKVLRVSIGGKEHTPEELSAIILKEIRKRAGNPTKAVLLSPEHSASAPNVSFEPPRRTNSTATAAGTKNTNHNAADDSSIGASSSTP